MSQKDQRVTATSENNESLEGLAIQWFMRIREPMSREEQDTFESWLQVDEHHQAFTEITRTWQALDACSDIYTSVEPTPSASRCGRLYTRRSFLYTTASFVLGLGVYGISRYSRTAPCYTRSFVTPIGELQEIALPDGTHASLDTDTALHVDFSPHKREVTVRRGQVMFDVSPDASKVFLVTAASTKITVTGTRFAVRNIDGIVKVAVQEGFVRVKENLDARMFDLASSDGLIIDGEKKRIERIKLAPELVGAWRHGRLSFENTRLADAIKEFARYGEKQLIATNEVEDLRITGSFDISSLHNFVTALPLVVPIRYVQKGDRLLVYKR